MPLSRRAIDELKTLYKQHRNETLSDEQATAIANRLLRAYHAITRARRERLARDKGANSAPVDPVDNHPLH